jgi:Ca2+/Na+ antiporter
VLAACLVVILIFVAVTITKGDDREIESDAMIFFGLMSLAVTLMLIASAASIYFTLTDQPYYVQKMYWILFYTAVVLALKWSTRLLDHYTRKVSRRLIAVIWVSLIVIMGAFPLTWNRTPLEATRHIAIDWFAEGMFVDVKDIRPYRAAVFNTWENLGAHVGNIALRQMSPTILPIDIAQSRNTQWACWYMRNQNVNLIYTATGQGAALIEAGCDQYATYIENGTRYDRLIPQAPALMLGKQVLASTTSEDAGYLSTGFFATEDSKIWATGFHSSVQMSAIESRTNLEMLFNLQRNTNHQFPVTIQTYINGRQIDSSDLATDQKTKTIMIPEINRNDHLSFQFVCQRSNDEVLETTNSGNPELLKCVGLEDFRVNASTT